jgi:phosphoglycerate dehydrogenase-like enzyme
MTRHVHLLDPPDADALAALRERLDPAVALTLGPELPHPARYQILVAGRPGPEHLDASPDLCALLIPWAGLPEATRELMARYPHVAVHNLHYNAIPAAEMALALLLAAAKSLLPMDRALRAHDWTPRYRPSPSPLLHDKTALILGYGAIGQHLARLCHALGMRVLATRRHTERTSPDDPAEVHPSEALDCLLPQANALLICLPHTPATDGLIGAAELAQLPPGAVLVNVGRAPIVQEAALYQALHDGTLHAAGLDVWYHYPPDEAARAHTPPSRYPFHTLDNVVMSPHRAGAVRDKEGRRMAHLARALNAAARGEPLPNPVDLDAGY